MINCSSACRFWIQGRELILCVIIFLLMAACVSREKPPVISKEDAIRLQGLPFVYKKWKQFSKKDGLPNDHVFVVKVDGLRVWVGTEDGLAMIEKDTGKIWKWNEAQGLPWKVVTGIDVCPKTSDVWLGLFGGGLARFSGYQGGISQGRFDHWHQLNSGLVNDVVYAVAVENDNVWAATTAGASRYNTVTGEWSIFTEKNAPMEEIWNYGVCYADGKVFLGIWGSGVLEYDIHHQRWKDYLDPDGEMEIDLYRDDGIVHVITTGVSYVNQILWVSSYFGASRYDGRHWRGYFKKDSGVPSDFMNFVKGRSAKEAWFCTDRGVGVISDFETNTWVTYTREVEKGKHRGKAVISIDGKPFKTIRTGVNIAHNYALCADIDPQTNDVWVGTSKGLSWGKGKGYYPGLAK